MPAPVLKLAVQVVKQISKPFAGQVSKLLINNPYLRKRFVIPLAEVYHRAQWRLMIMGKSKGKALQTPTLTEHEAVTLAGEILNDLVVFIIVVLLIYLENARSQRNSAIEKEKLNDRFQTLQNNVSNLEHLTNSYKVHIMEQEKQIEKLRAEVSDHEKTIEIFKLSGQKSIEAGRLKVELHPNVQNKSLE